MAFRPSAVALSKASRLPLTSKQANKDFYKGPGAYPGLGPRSQGHFAKGSKAPYKKDVRKMRYFVAPSTWFDEEHCLKAIFTSPLKPYVYKKRPQGAAGQPPVPKVPTDWPKAALGKTDDEHASARQGIYSPQGFNGEYYLQLAELNRGRTPA